MRVMAGQYCYLNISIWMCICNYTIAQLLCPMSYKQYHWYVRLSLLKYIIYKWLRSQSDHMLLRIIWRRWSQAYQWSHPPLPIHMKVIGFANSKVEGATVWWLFVVFPRMRWNSGCFICPCWLWILTAVNYKELGQTPLICETEPSWYNSK